MATGQISRRAMLLALVLVVTAGAMSACGGESASEPSGASDGAALLEEACTPCHDLGRVERAQKTRDEWVVTYERMIAKGSPAVRVADDKLDTLIDHLAENYGP